MVKMGIRGTDTTFVVVLIACGRSARLKEGNSVHGSMIKNFGMSTLIIKTALIDMYSKCRRVDAARRVFDGMLVRNIVSWNAMILGYCIHGCPDDGISLFHEMTGIMHCDDDYGGGRKERKRSKATEQLVIPYEITFIGVLCACGGLLSDGRSYFNQMSSVYNLKPKFAHYWCMANLYFGAGLELRKDKSRGKDKENEQEQEQEQEVVRNKKRKATPFRSGMSSLVKLMGEHSFKSAIKECHLEEMKKTPFFPLFKCCYDSKQTEKMVSKSSQGENVVEAVSKPDKKLLSGDALDFKVKYSNASIITTSEIWSALEGVVKKEDKESIAYFAKLMVLFMLNSVFFTKSNFTLALAYVHYVYSFEEMNKYWFCEHTVDFISPVKDYETQYPRCEKWDLSVLNHKFPQVVGEGLDKKSKAKAKIPLKVSKELRDITDDEQSF
ncbi:hypothetical protein IFM89_029559 [Coptis chinensis]|uniref:Pentatricopeptide repeat-containing protein n=1 Tax=Coptis chinensis TaxID=261450 RepID=A0A835LC33_9MAGN|nr:hypothetical protein IFM89_029559 [Coptis chinensis]